MVVALFGCVQNPTQELFMDERDGQEVKPVHTVGLAKKKKVWLKNKKEGA